MRLSLGRSSLYGMRLVDGFDLAIVWPERAALLDIDQTWPGSRPPGAPHEGWAWEPELRDTDERFALAASDGTLQAVWAVTKKSPTFDGRRWYRPNVIEVAPSAVRSGIGTATMTVIAKRARELDHEGVLVEALPDARGFYETLGARERGSGEFRNWRVNVRLVPLVFDRAAVDTLIEVFDGLCASPPSQDVP